MLDRDARYWHCPRGWFDGDFGGASSSWWRFGEVGVGFWLYARHVIVGARYHVWRLSDRFGAPYVGLARCFDSSYPLNGDCGAYREGQVGAELLGHSFRGVGWQPAVGRVS